MPFENSLSIIIVGCGALGSHLAGKLSRLGHGVVAVDLRESAFAGLPEEFTGISLEADAAEPAALKRLPTDTADMLIAATGDDNTNLLVAQTAKTVLGIPRVVARLADVAREEIFRDLDIETVCPARITAKRIIDSLPLGSVREEGEENR